MRHRVKGRKLGRTTAHRVATLRNLSTALFTHERITTTLMKAKEMRPFAEKLITVSRRDTLHARRNVARDIRDKAALKKLFETLGPRYVDRPGGYIRLYHLGYRPGDTADMAMVELVDAAPVELAGKAEEKADDKKTTEAQS
ncbi:MAG: 50S ribosomal protein L17 [Acidobacteria bacterium]|nr:50S ribosomal protein L17 [Acidobacteriota bacterium]